MGVCACSVMCNSFETPCTIAHQASSVHGIFQVRILEWVAISYSRGSSQHRGGTHVSCVSCIGRWILYHWRHLLCQVHILLILSPALGYISLEKCNSITVISFSLLEYNKISRPLFLEETSGWGIGTEKRFTFL